MVDDDNYRPELSFVVRRSLWYLPSVAQFL
jgi:hypothetical protein